MMSNKDLMEVSHAMDIGKSLHSLRLQRGLTQEELADRCELNRGVWQVTVHGVAKSRTQLQQRTL